MKINNVTVEVLKESDIDEYSALINEVMNEFNKEEVDGFQIWFASVEGITERRGWNDATKYATVQFAAKYEGRIIGALEVASTNHIQSFFVRKEFQKMGVGKKLFKASIKYFIDNGVKQKGYWVYSSDFGLNFYKKLGFEGDFEGDKILNLEIKYRFIEKTLLFYNMAFYRLQELFVSMRQRLRSESNNTLRPAIVNGD